MSVRRRRPRFLGDGCTGMNDRWCPVHGDCSCPAGGDPDLESRSCPVHALWSGHACDRWFVRQISPGLCVVMQYRLSPKLSDPNWYPEFWHGRNERGRQMWSLDLPDASVMFRRDPPGRPRRVPRPRARRRGAPSAVQEALFDVPT